MVRSKRREWKNNWTPIEGMDSRSGRHPGGGVAARIMLDGASLSRPAGESLFFAV